MHDEPPGPRGAAGGAGGCPPDPVRGFLPPADPLRRLPPALAAWDSAGRDLPKLLACGRVREIACGLPELDVQALRGAAELERAMQVLSFLAHAYVWGEEPPAGRLPARLAVPWRRVAEALGRPPVLSYASYCLHNWYRLDPARPPRLGNIALIQNFLGGLDEEWFVLVHVDIEGRAAPGLASLLPAQDAVARRDGGELILHLERIGSSLAAMNRVLERMPERCDPYIYFARVRPYIHGWKDNPALPEGLRYEDAGGSQVLRLRGETGAQSTIIPSMDAALGIEHAPDPLAAYLREMPEYMPPAHRAFIDRVAGGPSIRRYVLERSANRRLTDAYNRCVGHLDRFRHTHLEYAARYVHQQAQRSAANATEVGTGGTPFMSYLGKHRVETESHKI